MSEKVLVTTISNRTPSGILVDWTHPAVHRLVYSLDGGETWSENDYATRDNALAAGRKAREGGSA